MDKFYIVMKDSLPTAITTKHTKQSAINEAQRLARKDKGCRFIVMEAIKGYECNDIQEIDFEDEEDVCEWVFSQNDSPYNTSCGYNFYNIGYTVCPNCKKKIVVK